MKLKLPDVRFRGARKNIQSNAPRCHRRKPIDLLVTNRLSPCDSFPPLFLFAPNLNRVFLDVLSIIQPLCRDRMVERDRISEVDLFYRTM